MKEFSQLRAIARNKRDRAIAAARSDYAETLVRIAALEQDLTGQQMSSHRKTSVCIDSVIPQDRTFSTLDIMTSLEALDGRRAWRKRAVSNHLGYLRRTGAIRQVKKPRCKQSAVYARIGVPVEPVPFDGQTLAQVVESLLSHRKMNTTELVVAMLEAGYDTSMTPKALRDSVGVVLRNTPSRFKKDGSKWAVVRSA